MLKELRVKNFKSINTKQVFSFEAMPKSVVSEYPGHVVEKGDQRLLKVSSFYGPNGGGKSNLLDALYVLKLIVFGTQMMNTSNGNENYLPCLTCKSKISQFEIFIVRDNYEIGYSLEVDLSGLKTIPSANPYLFNTIIEPKIVKEEMIARHLGEKRFFSVFERNSDGIVTSKSLENVDLITNITPLAKAQTFILYYNTVFGKKDIHNNPLFSLFIEIRNICPLNRENRLFIFTKEISDFLKPLLPKTLELLKDMDFRITDLYFSEIEPAKYCLYVEKTKKDGKKIKIQLNNESSGTVKAINLIFDILDPKEEVLFLADDFDSHLHPKIIKAMIDLFNDPSNTTKQFIFNSHDISNMNNQVFRRDEIWFAYQNEDLESRYISLINIVDYKNKPVRKDAVYSKQYLEGRYGADPFIKNVLTWDK